MLDATIRQTLQRYPSRRPDAPTRESEAKAMAPADAWEREAQYAKELAKYGDDRQVIDCFARHMLAQSVAEEDPARRPIFDRNAVDKDVELLKNSKRFRLMVQTHGARALREALATQNPQAASLALFAPRGETLGEPPKAPERNEPRKEWQTPQRNKQGPAR